MYYNFTKQKQECIFVREIKVYGLGFPESDRNYDRKSFLFK